MMIEKVAAAMAEATNGGKWDDGHYCEDHKALWMKRAKAAIEAMREPTPAMMDKYLDLEAMDDDSPYNPPAAKVAWQAMVDVALGKTSSQT